MRPSLKRLGAHGHSAAANAGGALVLAATAALLGTRASDGGDDEGDGGGARPPSALFVASLGTLYVVGYLLSACGLTALNQMAGVHARRFEVRRAAAPTSG